MTRTSSPKEEASLVWNQENRKQRLFTNIKEKQTKAGKTWMQSFSLNHWKMLFIIRFNETENLEVNKHFPQAWEIFQDKLPWHAQKCRNHQSTVGKAYMRLCLVALSEKTWADGGLTEGRLCLTKAGAAWRTATQTVGLCLHFQPNWRNMLQSFETTFLPLWAFH